MKNRRGFYSDRVQYLPVAQIVPNPQQPRREFARKDLEELAQSIASYGILQPLTVRRQEKHYQLIAGERRLRAAVLAGLKEVPCILARMEERDAGFLALIENLQRRDLNCFEEAEAIAGLINRYGLSQEQTAQKLGKSQSAVANKLRLLRLPEDVREGLLENDLTERHARALLRLSDAESQRQALLTIVARQLNVSQTETLIESVLQEKQTIPPQKRTQFIIKDVRIFLNTIDRSLRTMRQAGVAAQSNRRDTAEGIVLTIRIPGAVDTK